MRSTAEDAPPVATSFPERIDQYELLIPIGTGGMATVYLARTKVMGELWREVALKLMHPHLRAGEGDHALQLIEEAKVAASIRHPNVVPVHEVGDNPHGIYLVMDYVPGDTLGSIIRAAKTAGQSVPLPIAGRILADALAGLHAAHELKSADGQPLHLVHRDFSPQNILVGIDGLSRLTDFGIAKTANRLGVTTTGIIKGKVGYMAPEQVLNQGLDRRCDIWAAGVVTWEVLAMRRMYHDADDVATLLQIVSTPPPSIRSIRPEVPAELEEVIQEALTADPNCRAASAEDLRARLMDAWRWTCGIADHAEVGAYVSHLTEAKLRTRQAQVESLLSLRAKIARVSQSAIAAAIGELDTTSSSPGIAAPSGSLLPSESLAAFENVHESRSAPQLETSSGAAHTSSGPPHLRSKLAVQWLGIALLLASALSLAAVAVVKSAARRNVAPESAPSTDTLEVRALPVESSAAVAAASGTAPGSELEPASTIPAAIESEPNVPPGMLIIRANALIATLRVGTRTIAINKQVREAYVKVSPKDQAGPLQIFATSADGRRAVARAAPSAGVVELSFGTATHPRRPSESRGSGAQRRMPTELAPSPYGNE